MARRRDAGLMLPLPAEGQHSLAAIMADFARREADEVRLAREAGLTRREFLHAMAAGSVAGGMAVAASGAFAAGVEKATAGAPTGSAVRSPTGSGAGASASSTTATKAAAGTPVKAAEVPILPRSRVIVVTHPEVIVRDYRVNPPIIRLMLDRAIVELTGKATPAEAWASMGTVDDFFAIKENTIGRPTLETHPEITEGVGLQLIAAAKVDRKNIFIVDREIPAPLNELSAPFTLPTRSLQTRLRRLYTDKATAIINVPVLKAHYGDGLSEALKNHLGSVNNPAAFHGWEKDHLSHSLPELNALPAIRNKTRLVIIDAIKPLFAGGPADDPQYRWDYKSLIVSTDPVAASAVGMRILEDKRAAVRGKAWPMTAAREMFAYAQAIGLGNADAERIDVVMANMA